MKKAKKKKDREVDKTWMPFSPRLVEEKKYNKYKDIVVVLGLGVQIMKSSYDSEMERRLCAGFSDKEIADLLGLDPWEVRKIRTVRETEITEGIIDKICEDSLDFQGIGPGIEDAMKLYKSLVK